MCVCARALRALCVGEGCADVACALCSVRVPNGCRSPKDLPQLPGTPGDGETPSSRGRGAPGKFVPSCAQGRVRRGHRGRKGYMEKAGSGTRAPRDGERGGTTGCWGARGARGHGGRVEGKNATCGEHSGCGSAGTRRTRDGGEDAPRPQGTRGRGTAGGPRDPPSRPLLPR